MVTVSSSLTASTEAQNNSEEVALSDEDDLVENELDDMSLSFRGLTVGLRTTITRLEADTEFLYNNMQVIREKLYTPHKRTASLDVPPEFHADLANDFQNVPELLEEEKERITRVSGVQDSVEFLQTSKVEYLNNTRTNVIEIRNDLCATKLSSRAPLNVPFMNTTNELQNGFESHERSF